MEDVQLAVAISMATTPAAFAVVHDQVEHVELVEERHPLLDALLVERLEDHVPGAVGGVASTTRTEPGSPSPRGLVGWLGVPPNRRW